MDEDVRCPVCGDVAVYAGAVGTRPEGGGRTSRWPTTLHCRNGCDRRDIEAWSAHVDAIRAEWQTMNGV